MLLGVRIGFAIPFYRGLDWLREAVESVRAQSVSDWRAVVLDDRGEDAGAVRALVEGLADPRIEYRANPATLGMVDNWNRGLDDAGSDLLTLLHADDRLLPDYAESMLALAKSHPGAAALCCAAQLIDSEGRPTWTLADSYKRLLVPRAEPWRLCGETGLRALLRGDFVMCPTLCWRRSVLASRRFEPGWRQVQDLELLTRLLLDGDEIIGTHRTCYAYRRHPESATALQSEDLSRFEEELALYDRLAAQAGARGWRAAERVARRKAVVRLHLGFRIAADLAALRPSAAARKLGYLVRGSTAVAPADSGGTR